MKCAKCNRSKKELKGGFVQFLPMAAMLAPSIISSVSKLFGSGKKQEEAYKFMLNDFKKNVKKGAGYGLSRSGLVGGERRLGYAKVGAGLVSGVRGGDLEGGCCKKGGILSGGVRVGGELVNRTRKRRVDKGKPRTSPWIKHVLAYAKKHKITYPQALLEARATYKR